MQANDSGKVTEAPQASGENRPKRGDLFDLSNKRRWLYPLLVSVLLGSLMLLFNLCIPNYSDDFHYGTGGWQDILGDAAKEWQEWNSRFVSCVLTRVVAIAPSWIVDICGTLAFIAMLWVMSALALGEDRRSTHIDWMLPLLAWVMVVATAPNFGECFLWHCGMAFYLYPILIVLCFILPLCRPADNRLYGASAASGRKWSFAASCAYVAMALLAGGSNENSGAVAFIMAAFITLYTWKTNPNRRLFALCCLSVLFGWLSIVLAPGPYKRQGVVLAQLGGEAWPLFTRCIQMAKHHLRAIPLYFATLCCMFALWRRGEFSRKEFLRFLFFVGAGLLCQAAFAGTSAVPAGRAHQIAFIFICIACLRVVYRSYKNSKYRKTWRSVVVLLSMIPLCEVPEFLGVRQWYEAALAQLEAARGSQADVVFPYWPYAKDRLLFSMDGYVPSESGLYLPYFTERWGVASVRQDSERCRYSLEQEDFTLTASSYDTWGWPVSHPTRTVFSIIAKHGLHTPEWLHVAFPDKIANTRTLRALVRVVSESEEPSLSYDDLVADGYIVVSLPVNEDGTVEWIRSGHYDKRPSAPVLWLHASSSPDPKDGVFLRVPPKASATNPAPCRHLSF